MIQPGYTPPAELNRVRTVALVGGVVLSALLVLGVFIDRAQFFHAYMVGFIFWTGITVGSLALLMLQHLTGGAWGLSLDPAWSSTIFGLIFVASWSLSALAFGILSMSWLSKREPMNALVRTSHFHDWGNLLLALVMLWTYFAFSQYLIIWSANLPEETVWYVARKHGGWGVIALGIVILQFVFPFMTLLSRAAKKSPQKLAMLAVLILAMRVGDVIWVI